MKYLHKQKGSVLLLMLLLLSPILLYVCVNFKMNDLGNEKMHHQSQTDALALQFSAYQMDALNSIAAYNEGIEITLNRAYMVATALMLLRACAVATLFTGPCTVYWARLEKKAIPFFKKINKLLLHFETQQDRIKEWAESTPYQQMNVYNLKHFSSGHNIQIYPKKNDFELPIRKTSAPKSKQNNPLYEGKDFMKCHTHTENNIIWLNSSIKKLSMQEDIRLDIIYTHKKTGTKETVHYVNISPTLQIPKKIYSKTLRGYLLFSYAEIQKCQSFEKLMFKLNHKIPLRIRKVSPYVLKKDYFKNGLQLTVESKKMISYKDLSNFNSSYKNFKHKHLLHATSTAKVTGHDIFETAFDIVLSEGPSND